SEQDRICRTGLSAGGLDVIFLAAVTQSAFVRASISLAAIQHSEWAGGNAITAAIANILLDIDVAEFVIDNRACRTRFFTRRNDAVFADVAHHQPAIGSSVTVELFYKFNMSPGCIRESDRVVITVAGPMKTVGR